MKYLGFLLALTIFLSGCAAAPAETGPSTVTEAPAAISTTIPTQPPATIPPDPVEVLLDSMTVEEKVGQLFLARCPDADAVTELQTYHLGGYILFGRDFQGQTPDSVRDTLAAYQSAASIPLLIAVDEEGGTVCRVSSQTAFRKAPFASPRSLYDTGGIELVLDTEAEKAALLESLGVNVNMAPVCDVATQWGAFMYRRSLGQSPEITGHFAAGAAARMADFQIGSVLKHFPGYGNNTDTHTGIATDHRSLEELEANDLIPFAMGIEGGCDAILVSHTIVTAFDSTLPATLSPAVHDYLRQEMGFGGVIVTDDLVMGAITETYGAGEAAVLSVLAGNDLLCSTEYQVQYQAVLEAVREGRISTELLNEAVTRILKWKQELGLIE